MEGDLRINAVRLVANHDPAGSYTIDNFLNMLIVQATAELEAKGYSNNQVTLKTYSNPDPETGKRTVTVEVVGSKIQGEVMVDADRYMATSHDDALRYQLRAQALVRRYVEEHLDKSDPPVSFEVYIVWFSKTLQNWKALLSTSLPDGMYYEVTHDGDQKCTYLDAYKKVQNAMIPDEPAPKPQKGPYFAPEDVTRAGGVPPLSSLPDSIVDD